MLPFVVKWDQVIFPTTRDPGRKLPAKILENLQNLQQETTIDLEAIQNKDVQIFMDNFNIHSLYN